MSRPMLLLASLVLVAVPAVANDPTPISLGAATLTDLAARPVAANASIVRHDERTHARPSSLPAGPVTALSVTQLTPKASLQNVRVVASVRSAASSRLAPPDASGAVGPKHLVGAYNSGVVVQDRSGKTLVSLSLPQFWSSSEPTRGLYFDPRVAYDAAADRWVLFALYDESGRNSTILFAASAGADPTGLWNRWRIPFSEFSDSADYARIAVTRNHILLATNGTEETVAYVIDRIALYGPAPALASTRVTLPYADMAPVTGDTPNDYFVYTRTGDIVLTRIADRGVGTVGVFRTPYGWFADGPPAPQFGTRTPIQSGYDDVASAVFRDGFIYGTNAAFFAVSAAAEGSIVSWKISEDGRSGSASILSDPTEFYAFPSLAVNRDGATLVGFARFSEKTYASSEYLYRDANGNTANGTLNEGDAPFLLDRWGDYTTTLVDPVNGIDFWTLQLHATEVQGSSAWATTWSKVTVAPAKRRSVHH